MAAHRPLTIHLDNFFDQGAMSVCHVRGPEEYGQFGWVIDPEGNKVELWQPPEGQ